MDFCFGNIFIILVVEFFVVDVDEDYFFDIVFNILFMLVIGDYFFFVCVYDGVWNVVELVDF